MNTQMTTDRYSSSWMALVGLVAAAVFGMATGCQHATESGGASQAESQGLNDNGEQGEQNPKGDRAGYDPCGSKTCGETCTKCAPGDEDCVETSVVKYCQADGSCASGQPQCKGDGYDPCAGKTCGESCTVCPPGDTDCGETDVLKQCNADGKCVTAPAQCKGGSDPGSPGYDPCGSKTCGETCTKCAPGDEDCVETSVVKYCQADGSCEATQPQCKGNGDGYDPCAGKTCGESCTKCAPGDKDCVETQELKACTASGKCVSAPVKCG